MTALGAVELADKRLEDAEYKPLVATAQVRLRVLQFRMYDAQTPVLALFEGWDASGKGGAIKRITAALEPRGYTVSSFAAPRGDEKTHHYLWRFWKRLPRSGHLGIFDRSYYGRVMVERVEEFCSDDEWRRSFREINEFEEQQTSAGMVICKFFLHLSQQEQLRRFRDRERDPFRSYKLTPEDWRNRARWDEYEQAIDEMLQRTSTHYAPWTIVEADDKNYARIKVLDTLSDAIAGALAK